MLFTYYETDECLNTILEPSCSDWWKQMHTPTAIQRMTSGNQLHRGRTESKMGQDQVGETHRKSWHEQEGEHGHHTDVCEASTGLIHTAEHGCQRGGNNTLYGPWSWVIIYKVVIRNFEAHPTLVHALLAGQMGECLGSAQDDITEFEEHTLGDFPSLGERGDEEGGLWETGGGRGNRDGHVKQDFQKVVCCTNSSNASSQLLC